jgi:hypothetical protein
MSKQATYETSVARLIEQLDWRGPNGKPQGTLTLTREQAAALVAYVQRDKLEVDE